MSTLIERKSHEDYYDYLDRLFTNIKNYGLTCEKIADLMNDAFGLDNGESKYRKEFKSFTAGREYERRLSENGVVTRILSISDLHVPFQKPIQTYEKYVGCIDILQINGDVVDFAAISRFPKVYRNSPMEEIIAARQYLIDLIEYLKPRKVSINHGNHDIRFESYFAKNLDSDLISLMPETPLDLICVDGFTYYDKRSRAKVRYEPICKVFDGVDIEYTGKWWSLIGGAVFAHPLAFKSGIMKTSQDAVTWFRNEGVQFTALVLGHTHRVGEYIIGNTMLYEQGACCETSKMRYGDGKLTMSQKEGFLYLCLDRHGNPMRDKSKLISLN